MSWMIQNVLFLVKRCLTNSKPSLHLQNGKNSNVGMSFLDFSWIEKWHDILNKYTKDKRIITIFTIWTQACSWKMLSVFFNTFRNFFTTNKNETI